MDDDIKRDEIGEVYRWEEVGCALPVLVENLKGIH
jgi:hypothetical protein